MRVGRILVGTCALLAWLLGHTAHADVTDDRRALVMLRVLAYDKHLADRAKGDVVTVVIAYPATDAGTAERTRWVTAFGNVSKLKVGGRAVNVIATRFEDSRTLARGLHDAHAAALLLCDGLGAKVSIADLAGVTRAEKVLSITTREAEVAKGIAVGIVTGAKRDEIVVNVRAATAEGVKFDAGLLQLARTVEEP